LYGIHLQKNIKKSNKALQLVPALRVSTGQFLSCGFVVLLRKSIPQNRNLKTAAELSYKGFPVCQAKRIPDGPQSGPFLHLHSLQDLRPWRR
jgi:hypothetical protein